MTINDTKLNFTVPAVALRDALKSIAFAMSSIETQMYLNGVYLHEMDGDLALMASDNHRIARRVIPAGGHVAKDMASILDKKSVSRLLECLSDEEEFWIADNEVRSGVGSHAISVTSIPGADLADHYKAFVQRYDALMPVATSHLSVNDFLAVIGKYEPSNGTVMPFDISDDLTGKWDAMDNGQAMIYLKSTLLHEVLQHIGDQATAQFFASNLAVFFRAENWSPKEFIALMPVKGPAA